MPVHRPSPTALLLFGVAACASGWSAVEVAEHRALREGATLVTWTRGTGAERERRATIREGDRDVAADSVEALLPHVRPLDTAAGAAAYADLAWRVGVTGAGAQPVTPDATLQGSGASGRYSVADAASWGIPFDPPAQPWAGGFAVAHVVLRPPVRHPDLPRAVAPWRLVLVREVVLPDGTLRPLEERTLTNGEDAARYARW